VPTTVCKMFKLLIVKQTFRIKPICLK
jgi:hypothetical protein